MWVKVKCNTLCPGYIRLCLLNKQMYAFEVNFLFNKSDTHFLKLDFLNVFQITFE